jgi:ribonuclease-3
MSKITIYAIRSFLVMPWKHLIGAIYIDKGYAKTKTFVRKRILIPFVDIELLENQEVNTKNKLIGWASKQGKKVDFVVV